MIRTKKEVVANIREVSKSASGKTYTMWNAYVGRDPISGRKIDITRANRAEVVAAVDRFYATLRAGVMPGDVKDALSQKDVNELRAAREALGGTPVLEAADILVRAREALDRAGLSDVTILDAVRAYAESQSGITPKTLSDALDAYVATFNAEQETYRQTIRTRVGRAVQELGPARLVSEITPTEALAYVDRNFGHLAEKTYNGVLGDLKTFFNWCAKPVRGFCRTNPLESAEKRREAYKRPEFMTPEETQRWLDILLAGACDEKSKALLWRAALGFFTGARTAEIQRLAWKDLDLDGRTVFFAEVKGSQHGAPPRFVRLNDAALAWLTARPLVRGAPDDPIFPSRDDTRSVSNALDRVARRNGLKIPKNAARHTFITMHVAAYHDAALTESIVGTSSTMRSGHYQSPVREEEALRYFNEVRPRG